MEVLDIGIKRPAILPPTIVVMMIFLIIKNIEVSVGDGIRGHRSLDTKKASS